MIQGFRVDTTNDAEREAPGARELRSLLVPSMRPWGQFSRNFEEHNDVPFLSLRNRVVR